MNRFGRWVLRALVLTSTFVTYAACGYVLTARL